MVDLSDHYKHDEDDEDDEDEAMDETVRPLLRSIPEAILTVSAGIQDGQRCRPICY